MASASVREADQDSALPQDFEDKWTTIPQSARHTTVRARVVQHGPKYCKVIVFREDYQKLCHLVQADRVSEEGRLYHATTLGGANQGPRSSFTLADVLVVYPEVNRSVPNSWVAQKGWVICWAARATCLAVLYINEAKQRHDYTDRHDKHQHGQFLLSHPFDTAPALTMPHHFLVEGSAAKARSGDLVRATLVKQTELPGLAKEPAFPWAASCVESMDSDEIDNQMATADGLSDLFTTLIKNEQELQRIEEKGQVFKTVRADWSPEPPFTATFYAPTSPQHAEYSTMRVREFQQFSLARIINFRIIVTLKGVVIDVDLIPNFTRFTVEFPMDSSATILQHGLTTLQPTVHGFYQLKPTSNTNFLKSQVKSIENWPSLSQRGNDRKRFIANMLLGQKKDPTVGTPTLPHEYTLTPGMTAPLTQAQSGVAAAVLADELPLVLCEGPPGTGKSRLIAQIIYQVIETGALFGTDPCVLVCASSNKATDAIGQLVHQVQIAADSSPTTAGLLKCVRMYTHSRELSVTACPQFSLHTLALDASLNGRPVAMQDAIQDYEDLLGEIKRFSLDGLSGADRHEALQCHQANLDELAEMRAELETAYLNWAKPNVIVATCNATNDERLDGLHFSHLIIDEVGQSSFPQVLQAFSRLDSSSCRQVLLVGDRHQLPPFSRSVGTAGTLMGLSLPQWLSDLDSVPNRRLLNCFRMHPTMLDFTAATVYNRPSQPENDLLSAVTPNQRALLRDRFPFPNRDEPILFLSAAAGQEEMSGSSRFNRVEANVIRSVVNFLIHVSAIPLSNIGVLTFYEAQRVCITSTLQSAGIAASREMVNNVDAFQGRERDVIILSCVRSSPDTDFDHTATSTSRQARKLIGFTDSMNRCNVATSRAKHGLIVVGNPHTMRAGHFWSALFAFYTKRRCIIDATTFDLAHFANTPANKWYEANDRLKGIPLR